MTETAGPVIAVIGNPNTGKSTLFNALTGLRQKTANYPGVTVERHTGTLALPSGDITLVDLPGTYSLAAHSPDEMVAIDVLMGRVEDMGHPHAVLVVADATNLRRNLFLVTQVRELGLPVVLALNMSDLAERKSIHIDAQQLGQRLGVRAVAISATGGTGMDELRSELEAALGVGRTDPLNVMPQVRDEARRIYSEITAAQEHGLTPYDIERALIDAGGFAERRLVYETADAFAGVIEDARMRLSAGSSLAAMEAKRRYDLIDEIVAGSQVRQPPPESWQQRLDTVTHHPVWGSMLFLLVMATVFQAVFAWATPLMDLIDAAAASLGAGVSSVMPDGALRSLVVDGVIAGVGAVVIFLPQILILFAFIIVLEDSGYMPRAAFMMDRLMRTFGLSGQSFIPMLSGFACAVPGIMACRVIPDRRDRLATIMAVPFMTCSARLPVYALLIAAFVPQAYLLGGFINLQGLVLLGLYLLGIAGGVVTALLMKRTALSGATPTFLIELPPYRLPNLRSVLLRLVERGKVFLVRAGTIIFAVAVVIWGMAYFPRQEVPDPALEAARVEATATLTGESLEMRLGDLDNRQAAMQLEQSYLGRLGHGLEPLFRPLGWDWKISAAVVASFPAREVVIAVLGTIYAVGDEVDETSQGLMDRLKRESWSDGRPVYTLGVALGLLVFYAFCLQCAATVAAIRRETNTWRWPVFAWTYMTSVGYLSALLVTQLVP